VIAQSFVMHPTPSGTRDVLPDEMRELRAITEAMRATFEERDYGEVYTPALEYEHVQARGGAAAPAYKLFDEQGNVLVLRSDMTLPIARVVSTRYAQAEPPLRFSYLAHAYRSVVPKRSEAREMLQAGIELVGSPGAPGTAEALEVLCAALDAAGLEGYRIGLGDASLFPALLAALQLDAGAAQAVMQSLSERDFVGLEATLETHDVDSDDARLLLEVAQTRGGREVLEHADGHVADAAAGMLEVHELLPAAAAERLIFDLGLSLKLGYYTGAVFEVYDAALGAPIGGGGRYDDLLARFGRSLPAVGWALNVERLHLAAVGEQERRAWG
jgi:ATP phosphoribosyltransferase regulatory subunit